MLKIKNAIIHYNDNERKDGEPKMNQKFLSVLVLPEENESLANFYMSQWSNHKSMSKLKPEHVIRICLNTGVDPNFIFDWDNIIKNEKLLKDEKQN